MERLGEQLWAATVTFVESDALPSSFAAAPAATSSQGAEGEAEAEAEAVAVAEREAVVEGEAVAEGPLLVSEEGPNLTLTSSFRGTAASKREAEKIAARAAVAFLKAQAESAPPPPPPPAARAPEPEQLSTEHRATLSRARKHARAESGIDHGPVRAAEPEIGSFEYSERAAAVRTAHTVDQPLADLGSFARQLGGFVEWHVAELGHQNFAATVRLVGLDAEAARLVGTEALLLSDTPSICGEPARSKKLASQAATRMALAAWVLGYEDGSWVQRLAAATQGRGLSDRCLDGEGGGHSFVVLPLRASQWRGASCAVLVARALAHLIEVRALRADLSTLLPADAVPSLAQLRIATTPRSIAGYRYSNEQVQWVGNAALGVCSKVAAVLALGAPPREVQSIFDHRYTQLTSTTQLAAMVEARCWEGAIFMRPWPGANGVTRCEATAELKKEMLEAIVGAVFLARDHGLDSGLEDTWRLASALVFRPRFGQQSWVTSEWTGAEGPVALLRARLVADRPGQVRAWVDRLSLRRPTEPGLIAAASLRGYEGQSLEFIGDG